MAPSRPYRYKDVGDFINSSKQVVGYSRNLVLPEAISKFSPVFFNVLKRHGVPLDRIKDSFHILHIYAYITEDIFAKWDNLSRVGYLDGRVTNYIPFRMEKLQVSVDMITSEKMKSEGEKYICDKFIFGNRQTSYSYFGFALARRATQIHASLLEFGIPLYWDDVLFNHDRLQNLRIKRENNRKGWDEEERYIGLKHQRQFLVMNLVALLLWGGVFIAERRETVMNYVRDVFTGFRIRVKIVVCQVVQVFMGMIRNV